MPTTVPPTTAPPAGGAAPGAVPAGQKDAVSGRALWAVPKGDSLVAPARAGPQLPGHRAGVGRRAGGCNLTNEVDVEQYLRGLGEVPASWPAAALQAQAIAARTFAIRAASRRAGRCATTSSARSTSAPATSTRPPRAAAIATKGQVLVYKGALAETVYSASAGGLSATPEEGFGPGSPDLPYLKPVAYTVGDPQLWAMTLRLKEAGARFGYRGQVSDIRVTRTGPSGRPLEITFEGDNGPMVIDGHRFWAELQLRSTLFTLRVEADAPVVEGEPFATLVDLPPGIAGLLRARRLRRWPECPGGGRRHRPARAGAMGRPRRPPPGHLGQRRPPDVRRRTAAAAHPPGPRRGRVYGLTATGSSES